MFFFCCLLYGDDSDYPAAVELGLLRAGGAAHRLSVSRSRVGVAPGIADLLSQLAALYARTVRTSPVLG